MIIQNTEMIASSQQEVKERLFLEFPFVDKILDLKKEYYKYDEYHRKRQYKFKVKYKLKKSDGICDECNKEIYTRLGKLPYFHRKKVCKDCFNRLKQ